MNLQKCKIKLNKNSEDIKYRDNCVILKNDTILIVDNIVIKNGSTFLVGRTFLDVQPIFIDPCGSRLVGIYCVSELGTLESFPYEDILEKVLIFPKDSKLTTYIVQTLLHTSEDKS